MAENARNTTTDPVKRLAALTHAIVARSGPAASYAELKGAVADQAARLRIPYDAGTVTAAIALVERTRPVLEPLPMLARRAVERPPEPAPDPSREEASRIVADLLARFEQEDRHA